MERSAIELVRATELLNSLDTACCSALNTCYCAEMLWNGFRLDIEDIGKVDTCKCPQ
jgi:hypothetical protein